MMCIYIGVLYGGFFLNVFIYFEVVYVILFMLSIFVVSCLSEPLGL